MGKKEKLMLRLQGNPKDFTFDEMKTALESLGFQQKQGSGSRVKFIYNGIVIRMHKPHPRKELLEYQVKQILELLEKEDLL